MHGRSQKIYILYIIYDIFKLIQQCSKNIITLPRQRKATCRTFILGNLACAEIEKINSASSKWSTSGFSRFKYEGACWGKKRNTANVKVLAITSYANSTRLIWWWAYLGWRRWPLWGRRIQCHPVLNQSLVGLVPPWFSLLFVLFQSQDAFYLWLIRFQEEERLLSALIFLTPQGSNVHLHGPSTGTPGHPMVIRRTPECTWPIPPRQGVVASLIQQHRYLLPLCSDSVVLQR